VGDRSELFSEEGDPGLAPPMAVAALSLRGVVNDLAVPAGTLHAGQELEFSGAVQVGETLACKATVLQNSVRGAWRFLVVGLSVEDGRGVPVMSGKSTLVVPVGQP
jgi:acyl dehydratase